VRRTKGLLKELKRRNVGHRELAVRLTARGVPETERNLANKISRGGFTAASRFNVSWRLASRPSAWTT